jgi:hypothetical protein
MSAGGEFDRRLAVHGLSFLVSGMESLGFFELHVERASRGDFLPGTRVGSVVGREWRYISVLPRRVQGGRKEHVVERANVLWMDVDDRGALGYLHVFEKIGLPPSAVVDSGGGFWLYWKLSELVPVDQIEEWNKKLIVLAGDRMPGVDKACWARNRMARLVGTKHEETGIVANFVDLHSEYVVEQHSPWTRYAAEEIEKALSRVKLPAEVEVVVEPRVIAASDYSDQVWSVYNRFRWYFEVATEEEVNARGRARAGIEFAIVCELIECADSTDAEIRALFDEWQPLKHVARKKTVKGNPYGYLDQTIRNARKKAEPGSKSHLLSGKKRKWNPVDRWEALWIVAEAEQAGEPMVVGEACAAILRQFPEATHRTAENALIQLKRSGYIDKLRKPGGPEKFVVLTADGWEFLLQEGFQRGIHRLTPLKPVGPDRSHHRLLTQKTYLSRSKVPEHGGSETYASTVDVSLVGEGEVGIELSSCGLDREHFGKVFGYGSSRYLRHAGWEEPDGKLQTILDRSWIDDWYRLTFLGHPATRIIQFTTDWDERTPELLFYEQLRVGIDEYPTDHPGVVGFEPVFRSFISQRDPQLGGRKAHDPIADGVWVGWNGMPRALTPRPFTFGLALQLTEKFEPMTRLVVNEDRQEIELPRYGLVIERDWKGVFWGSLAETVKTLDTTKLTEVVLRVSRSGPKGGHKFEFEIIGDAIDFAPPEEAKIDMEEVLTELASEERLSTYISTLPPGFSL